MKRFLTNLALLVLIAGLPLQNLHAFSMLLCNQSDQTSAAPQHSDLGDVAEHDNDHQTQDLNLMCNGCGMFHNCSAPAIATHIFDISLDIVATLSATTSNSVTLFIPEQPQRPPRV